MLSHYYQVINSIILYHLWLVSESHNNDNIIRSCINYITVCMYIGTDSPLYQMMLMEIALDRDSKGT